MACLGEVRFVFSIGESPSPPNKKIPQGIFFVCEKELELERRESARGVRGVPLPMAEEGSPQNWQKANEYKCALAYEV